MSIWKNGKLIAGGSQALPLLSFMWADHQLNDVSWLRADTFSWQDGEVYFAAYNHLKDEITGKTLQSETVAGVTIQFYLADDGHKICPASEESNVLAIYNATGVAWYYIIDTANQRFKLPRAKHNKYANSLGVIGNGMTLGITNGSVIGGLAGFDATVPNRWANYGLGYNTGALGRPVQSTGGGSAITNSWWGVTTDPTKSGIIAQQEQDTDQYKYLYFYVGQFTQTALENTAGLNAELFNGKADTNLMNTATNVDFVVESQLPTAENNYTWYRKYKSGWIEQGGNVELKAQTNTRITLPIAMANTNYNVQVTGAYNNASNTYGNQCNERTTTSIVIKVGGYQSSDVVNASWYVVGTLVHGNRVVSNRYGSIKGGRLWQK